MCVCVCVSKKKVIKGKIQIFESIKKKIQSVIYYYNNAIHRCYITGSAVPPDYRNTLVSKATASTSMTHFVPISERQSRPARQTGLCPTRSHRHQRDYYDRIQDLNSFWTFTYIILPLLHVTQSLVFLEFF